MRNSMYSFASKRLALLVASFFPVTAGVIPATRRLTCVRALEYRTINKDCCPAACIRWIGRRSDCRTSRRFYAPFLLAALVVVSQVVDMTDLVKHSQSIDPRKSQYFAGNPSAESAFGLEKKSVSRVSQNRKTHKIPDYGQENLVQKYQSVKTLASCHPFTWGNMSILVIFRHFRLKNAETTGHSTPKRLRDTISIFIASSCPVENGLGIW